MRRDPTVGIAEFLYAPILRKWSDSTHINVEKSGSSNYHHPKPTTFRTVIFVIRKRALFYGFKNIFPLKVVHKGRPHKIVKNGPPTSLSALAQPLFRADTLSISKHLKVRTSPSVELASPFVRKISALDKSLPH